MLALINITILFFASGGGDEGGFMGLWHTYVNYPGFELWKLANLAIFVAALVYFLKRPLSENFKAKREEIRSELIKAEEAKKEALAQLAEIEAKQAGIAQEAAEIRREAEKEVNDERSRLVAQAESEVNKINAQTDGEITRIGQVARLELRRFGVEESIRRAEEKLKEQVNSSADEKLISAGIKAIGGVN